MNWSELVYHGREKFADYNPLVIREFREAMEDAYQSVAALNQAWGSAYAGFGEVDPPRDPREPDARWDDWNRFRKQLITAHVQDMVKTIRAAGLPAELIYTHQLPFEPHLGPSGRPVGCNDLATGIVDGARLGINLVAGALGDIPERAAAAANGWGVTEFAALEGLPAEAIAEDLRRMARWGASFVAPFYWDAGIGRGFTEGPGAVSGFMAAARINGRAHETALRRFCSPE